MSASCYGHDVAILDNLLGFHQQLQHISEMSRKVLYALCAKSIFDRKGQKIRQAALSRSSQFSKTMQTSQHYDADMTHRSWNTPSRTWSCIEGWSKTVSHMWGPREVTRVRAIIFTWYTAWLANLLFIKEYIYSIAPFKTNLIYICLQTS